MSLRPATEDDIVGLALLDRKTNPSPWNESHFEAELTKPFSKVWVLTDDETDSEILGFTAWELSDNYGRINQIAVEPTLKRKGLGSQFLNSIVTELLRKSVPVLELEVRNSNTVALDFYQARGFEITKKIKGFYSNGDDAYVLGLDLTDQAKTLKKIEKA